MRSFSGSVIVLCLAVGLCAGCGREPVAQQGEWPRFRGPAGDGVSEEASAPKRWSEDSRKILWKTRIPGAGNSSPIVADGTVYLTTAYGEATDDPEATERRQSLQRVVMALDLATGEMLWSTTVFTGPKGALHWFNTHAGPTPATDGNRLFVSFDSRLAALDLDGEIVWQKNFDPNYVANSRYGSAASVALSKDAVILSRDREDAAKENAGFLLAVSKETGEEIWRHEWKDTCCSYTTPLVVERGGREEVLNSISGQIVSYDASTGDRLWSAEHPAIQPVPSLLLEGDLLVSPGAMHSKELRVFRLVGHGPDTQVQLLWKKRTQVPDIPSPVLHTGRLFTVTESGIMAAHVAETGEMLWRARLPAGSYQGSPVATAEHIYLPTANGTTAVVSTQAPKFKLLAENRLPDGSGASPALTSTCLLLRTATQLYCIGEGRRGKKDRGVEAG